MADISDTRRGELEALADKSTPLAALLGFVLGPLGYVYVGSWRWAVINFVTINYLLLGVILVPLHTVAMVFGARWKLRQLDTESGAAAGDSLWKRLGAWYGERRY